VNETTRTIPAPKVIDVKTSPRLSQIYLLLQSRSGRNFTRREICNVLGYPKSAHMIRLIERGCELTYWTRDVEWNDSGQMFYVYQFNDLPF